MHNYFEEIAVVIRYSGETTFNTLRDQIKNQMVNVKIECVTSDTFEETLRLSFEKSIDIGKKWSLIVDADVLFCSKFFTSFLPRAIAETESACLGFGVRVWDRFYDAPKYRGVHIYRTEHLENGLKKIPKTGTTLRPETKVKMEFQREGLKWLSYVNIMGLHDFYQQPKDIFAKMALRAKRSSNDLDYLLAFFNKHKRVHPDFEIGLAGLKYGMSVDINQIDNSRVTYLRAFEEVSDQIFTTVGPFIAVSQSEIDWKLINLIVSNSFKSFTLFKMALKNYNSLVLY